MLPAASVRLAVLILAGAAQAAVVSPKGAPYSYDVPAPWIVGPVEEGLASLLGPGKTRGFRPGIHIETHPEDEYSPTRLPHQSGAQDYLLTLQARLGQDKAWRVSKPRMITIAGRAATRIVSSRKHRIEPLDIPTGTAFPPFDALITEDRVILPLKQGFLVLAFKAAGQDYKDDLPAFESVLKSLRLKTRT